MFKYAYSLLLIRRTNMSTRVSPLFPRDYWFSKDEYTELRKLLKSDESSTKAYIPVRLSNFFRVSPSNSFRVSHVGDVSSTPSGRESLPQVRVAHKNDANFPSIVMGKMSSRTMAYIRLKEEDKALLMRIALYYDVSESDAVKIALKRLAKELGLLSS